MSDVTFAPGGRANRIYGFQLPCRVPGFGIGIVVKKLKHAGHWDGIPVALRHKAKQAKASWTGMHITKADLDSIPDDVWQRIASDYNLDWKPV